MRALLSTPLETTISTRWNGLDARCRRAFLAVLALNVVAFGFEMTNLTLNHDDVNQIFLQSTILGHYLGRFGVGWLHYYTQNHYVMPFLQMLQGMLIMSAYGVLVAHFLGARRATDLAVAAGIVCVFPYMAHVYQYNTSMATYPSAHLLVAIALVLSVRPTALRVAVAALLYVAAFSIYQGVAANAATIFVLWLLARHLFNGPDGRLFSRTTGVATLGALAAVVAGGLAYIAAVSAMNLEPDTIHSTGEAFRLKGALNPLAAIPDIVQGTRAFFAWSQAYFPGYLKALQLLALVAAGLACVRIPQTYVGKLAALALLGAACFAPRSLQVLHSKGHFHVLTLTAYAVLFAGAFVIVARAAGPAMRNFALVASALLIGGYVMQCNWISTVNHLNTVAHFATTTQILARLRSLPDAGWDGKMIAVFGRYDMPSNYPFRGATGIANEFVDRGHIELLSRLMRDEARVVAGGDVPATVAEQAARMPAWPTPGSVAIVDGMGVVVLSRSRAAPAESD